VTHSFHNFKGQTEIVFIEDLKGEDRGRRPARLEVSKEKGEVRVSHRSQVSVVLVFANAVGMKDTNPIMILRQIGVKGIALEKNMPDIQADGEVKLVDDRVNQSERIVQSFDAEEMGLNSGVEQVRHRCPKPLCPAGHVLRGKGTSPLPFKVHHISDRIQRGGQLDNAESLVHRRTPLLLIYGPEQEVKGQMHRVGQMVETGYFIERADCLLIRKIGFIVRLKKDKLNIIHIGSQEPDIGDQVSGNDVGCGSQAKGKPVLETFHHNDYFL
jgi:hypothetical protein